jgi:hypothetical protein
MGGTGVDKWDQVIDRKTWKKLFKGCRCKNRYKKAGSGGTDIQCQLLAFPYFGRCYFRKCPKIKPNWKEQREWWAQTADGPILVKKGYLKSPLDEEPMEKGPT